jgi:signal peptidase complex subunit 3
MRVIIILIINILSKMYSLSGRLNTIAFNTLMFLAALSALNFLSCYPFSFLGEAR